MAVTYRAHDTVLNSAVALKIIDRSAARNPGVRSRFLREARAAAQIRHPNVAHACHYGEQDGECFYVMELVEGETLATQVRRNGPMPLTLALGGDIGYRVCFFHHLVLVSSGGGRIDGRDSLLVHCFLSGLTSVL
jgi:serine/threonine protein kinase